MIWHSVCIIYKHASCILKSIWQDGFDSSIKICWLLYDYFKGNMSQRLFVSFISQKYLFLHLNYTKAVDYVCGTLGNTKHCLVCRKIKEMFFHVYMKANNLASYLRIATGNPGLLPLIMGWFQSYCFVIISLKIIFHNQLMAACFTELFKFMPRSRMKKDPTKVFFPRMKKDPIKVFSPRMKKDLIKVFSQMRHWDRARNLMRIRGSILAKILLEYKNLL